MKLISKYFLIFLFWNSFSLAYGSSIISHRCGHNYIEGEKVMNSAGIILRVCWHRKYLPKKYKTDIDTKCAHSHQEGSIDRSGKHFDSKWCIKG